MEAELVENMDSHAPTEKPHYDLQGGSNQHDQEPESRLVTWTFECSGVKVSPKAYDRLKTEIEWTEAAHDGCMTFRSTDGDAIDAFSKRLRTIF